MAIWKRDVPIQRMIDYMSLLWEFLQRPTKTERERESDKEIALLREEIAKLRRALDNANDPTWGPHL